MSEPRPGHALSRYRITLSAVVLTVMLAACAVPNDVHTQVRKLDETSLGLQAVKLTEMPPPLPAWWLAYGDGALNQLIEQALSDNPSMAAVQARLGRAQAQERYTQGADAPKLQATGEVDHQQFSEHGFYPPPLAGSTRTSGTTQMEGSWEFDLFGRQRAELEAAVGQTRAAQADGQAARLMLSGQVARTHVQLARLLSQRDVQQRALKQREDMLSLIHQRVAAGLDTTIELRQGEGSLPDTRMQIEALNEQIVLTRHALAAMAAKAPAAMDDYSPALASIKPLAAPQQVPVDLLARRADVMAALWRAEAAGHQVDAARAAYYPNIDLRAYTGLNAIGLDKLLDPTSLQWGLMPAIHLPLLDGDRRRANLQGKVAEQDAAVANYNQIVLQAVQEVADQLSSTQAIGRQRHEQALAQVSAEAAYDLALQRYKGGLGTYLVVLNAEFSVLNQRRQAVDLQARLIDTQMALIKALGGSLEVSSKPTAAMAPSPQAQPIALSGERS